MQFWLISPLAYFETGVFPKRKKHKVSPLSALIRWLEILVLTERNAKGT
jgi:hypothetical protein